MGSAELSQLELRYPFTPRSRGFFENIPVEEGLASGEVLAHAQERLLNALGRGPYKPDLSELIEFSSFFVAALVASRDGYLATKFGEKEGERAWEFFRNETPASKSEIFGECFGVKVEIQEDHFVMRFEDYLTLTSKYELTKSARWKLARQDLDGGKVRFDGNILNDLFADCSGKAVAAGAKNMKRTTMPKQLSGVTEEVMKYVPAPVVGSSKGYAYVDDLLDHPVSDGRHRLVWMVLAPYLVNVKKLPDEAAVDRIRSFVQVAGETADMKRFVEYNVKRARRNGLMPPTFATLKREHPDLYSLLPPAVIATQSQDRKSTKAGT